MDLGGTVDPIPGPADPIGSADLQSGSKADIHVYTLVQYCTLTLIIKFLNEWIN